MLIKVICFDRLFERRLAFINYSLKFMKQRNKLILGIIEV